MFGCFLLGRENEMEMYEEQSIIGGYHEIEQEMCKTYDQKILKSSDSKVVESENMFSNEK